MKGIKIPLTNEEAKYTKWQEAVRKDIEHAFGNLKFLWKFVCHPIEIWSLNDIEYRITTSLILHNIVVADWVMSDDPNVQYNPSKTIEDQWDFAHVAQTPYISWEENDDINVNQEVGGLPQSVHDCVVATGQWEALANEREHGHIHSALMKQMNEWQSFGFLALVSLVYVLQLCHVI